jgi:transcription elongation factor Elf1
MFNDWLKLLKALSKNNYSTKGFICPECGKKSIEYVYVGNPTTRIGYLPIWCKNCNKGIRISRVEIPKEINMIEFGDLESIAKTIPNFKQVVPEK